MIVKMVNGVRTVVADVSSVKTVNRRVGHIFLHGENLPIGRGLENHNTTIKQFINICNKTVIKTIYIV